MLNVSISADFKPTLEWLERIKKGLDDATPLWVALFLRIQEMEENEFVITNPSRWHPLTKKYRAWKIKKGYGSIIGVLGGDMKAGATVNAKANIQKKYMNYILNEDGVKSKKGYPYAQVFHWGKKDGSQKARPIFKSTVPRVNQFLRTDIQNRNGGDRSSFTFKWIEKAIKPYQVKK